jgi:hypothetical protein
MHKLAYFPIVAALLSFRCAHAEPSHAPGTTNDSPVQTSAAVTSGTSSNTDPLLIKFDPMLRWALRDKLGGYTVALADLRGPLPQAVLTDLEAHGLIILSANSSTLHVKGDPEALLRLASRSEVIRIRSSSPLKPSVKE